MKIDPRALGFPLAAEEFVRACFKERGAIDRPIMMMRRGDEIGIAILPPLPADPVEKDAWCAAVKSMLKRNQVDAWIGAFEVWLSPTGDLGNHKERRECVLLLGWDGKDPLHKALEIKRDGDKAELANSLPEVESALENGKSAGRLSFLTEPL